ncbi:hypothetical protein GCM10023192_34890 [Amycolatopsis samaneae]
MTEQALNRRVAKQAVGERRKRAVLYLRVSTPGQVNTDYNPEGISIPAQRQAGKRKADSLDADIVREFVEPGRTATSIDKRPTFQEMVAWVKAQKDIDYVIVYHFNRVFRNSVDAGMTKRDLKKVNTRVVSTVLDMGENAEATMVESIIHAVDQYQSEASGADISYKMGQKVRNGGSVGVARLGYLNVREPKPEGGEIRTIAVDPERAPLIQLAFELYATGEYTLADLDEELYDRGLRTRPTPRRPAKRVSINKLSLMLRDRYYIGYVTHEGEEVRGRHKPLIDPVLFEQVQEIAESRTAAKERRRVHHHYLKGSLFCGRCKRTGRLSRMIIQRTVNSRGTEYMYFFCRNKQSGTCRAPHLNILHVEEAIEAHYATVRFSLDFIAGVRTHVATALEDEQAASRLLHQQLTAELRDLDAQEENLIDLAAKGDDGMPQAKIKERLYAIGHQRERLTARLNGTTENLAEAARLIELCLTLLENPQELYLRCDDEQRRLLNQALFEHLFVEEEDVTDHDLREPFATLHAVQADQRPRAGDKPDPGGEAPRTTTANGTRAVSRSGDGPRAVNDVEALLQGIELDHCSSGTRGVELRGIEPLTFSMRTRRATNCATAPCLKLHERISASWSPVHRGSLPGGTTESPGPGVGEVDEGGVLVFEVHDDGLPAGTQHRGRLAFDDLPPDGSDDLDVLYYRLLVGLVDRGAAGCARVVEARHATLPDLVLDANLPAEVAEVADEGDVGGGVAPPDERDEEPGDRGGGHGDDEQNDDDALPEGVFRAGGDLRGFGVEAAPAGAVAVPLGFGALGTCGLGQRIGLGFLFLEVRVEFRFELGEVVLHRRLRAVGHGELLLSFVACIPAAHHPCGERGVGRPRDLLALAGDHGHEYDEPCRGERDDDHGAGHLPSPPPNFLS